MKNLNFLENFFFYNNIKNKFYYNDFCIYKYNKSNRKLFFKKLNNQLVESNKKSFIRDKNILILKKYFNTSIYNGKKEFFFNQFNKFVKNFYFLFLKKNNYFLNYVNYINVFKLISIKKIYFNFNFFIKEFIFDYNSIFDIKMCKIQKKYKNKTKLKKKFNFELVYVFKEKRLKYTLKLINNYVKKNNNFFIKEKFF